jgi:hypothetical protein
MRKLLLLGWLSLGLASSASSHQRAAASSFVAPAAARPAPAPAHPAAPAHTGTSHVALPAAKTAAAHQKTLPRPTNIIVYPVSSLTTTTSCSKHFSYPVQGLNGCPSSAGISPLYGGGYYIPVPYYYTDSPAAELPPGAEDAPQLASNEPSAGGSGEPAEEGFAVALGHSASSINEALAEFVFVNRDGTKFNAVAYSFVNDKLQYVTKAGVRRSASLDSLDLNATQKLNEELGNTINLPSLPASGVAENLPASTLH